VGPVQVAATVVAAFVTIAAVALAARAVRRMVRVIRLGQPVPADRFEAKARRSVTMLRETLGHTRMLKWSGVGLAHWFVMMSFLVLFLLVVEAYIDVASPSGTRTCASSHLTTVPFAGTPARKRSNASRTSISDA